MLAMLAVLMVQDPGAALASTYFPGLPVVVSTYEVTGANDREVWASLEARQPTHSDGSRSQALTSWKLPTQWGHDVAGACAPATVRIRPEVEVLLPVLSPDAILTAPVRAKWDYEVDTLARHEAQRVGRVMSGARALEQRLRSEPDCSRLQTLLNEGVAAIGAQARALDLESPLYTRLYRGGREGRR